ncbi:MAG: hypothetical protein J5649_04365 [Lachnospiraceae bacterium]|nr:hypothetical protein [Lachnospiraceae bacterium]
MRRKRWLQTAIVLAAMCVLGACSRGSHNEDDYPTPTPTQTTAPTEGQPELLTPTATPTQAVTPTQATTPTVTPTQEATPTLTQAPDYAAMAARSRELHEAIAPKLTANPLGTGSELSEQDKINYEYGFRNVSGVDTVYINLETGEEASYDDRCRMVRVSGLKDQDVLAKINKRIETAARTMLDPGYLPDVPGIMLVVKERGLPEAGVQCYAGSSENGILHIGAEGQWVWHEDMEFADYDELHSYINADENRNKGILTYMDYTILSEAEDHRMEVRIDYGITETIEYNFDLSTGEEISLSDLFPAGFDYLTYLNEEMEKESKYVFWFSDYEYQNGNGMQGTHVIGAYDETQEYDGGHLPETIAGDETFCAGVEYVELKNSRGGWEVIYLPAVVGNRDRNGDIYEEQHGVYTNGALGYVYLCDVDTDGPRDAEEIGQFRIRLNGADKMITVTVYRGVDLPYWSAQYDRRFGQNVKEDFSDKKILEYAKQCMSMWTGAAYPEADCELYIKSADVYPNGYYCIDWYVSYKEFPYPDEEWKGYYDDYWGKKSWMKDGTIITQEELLDVSYEDLLTELIGDLKLTGDGTKISEEAARTAAKALMPYFVGLDTVASRQNYWDWRDYLFLWKEGSYVHNGVPNRYYDTDDPNNENIPAELKDLLPQKLWRTLSETDIWLEHSDPYVLLKHLKMYEGYPFPQN